MASGWFSLDQLREETPEERAAEEIRLRHEAQAREVGPGEARQDAPDHLRGETRDEIHAGADAGLPRAARGRRGHVPPRART